MFNILKRGKLLVELAILLAGMLLGPSRSVAGQYLYNVSFDPPLYKAGEPVLTGLGPTSPTFVYFGDPIVESAFGHLTNQPLVFPAWGYQQIWFDLGYYSAEYFVEFDIETHNLSQSPTLFTVLFDTPKVQNFTFNRDGGIGVPNGPTLPGLTDDEPHHVQIHVNLTDKTWGLQIDDRNPAAGVLDPSSPYLAEVRFNFGDHSAFDTNVQVAIDNIHISNSSQPEPPQINCAITDFECSQEGQFLQAFVGSKSTNPLLITWDIDGIPIKTNTYPSGAAIVGFWVTLHTALSDGQHSIMVNASTGDSPVQTCSSSMRVGDTTPPVVSSISATPRTLWPPNGRMVSVRLQVEAADNCGLASSRIVQVRSDEPARNNARGRSGTDWEIVGNLTVNLRAESGSGVKSRTYLVDVESKDLSGNVTLSTIEVHVLRDR